MALLERLEVENRELLEAQRNAQAALAQHMELYDTAPVGLATLDERGRILEVNRTLAAWLHQDKSDCVTELLSQYLVKDDVTAFTRHLRESLRSDAPVSTELTLQCGETQRFVQLRSLRAFGPDERVVIRTAVTDLSERRRTELSQQLLAEAGALLTDPVDLHAMLARVATLAVCHLGDHCSIYLPAEGDEELRCVARADRDGQHAPDLAESWHLNPERFEALLVSVFQSGRTEWLPTLPQTLLANQSSSLPGAPSDHRSMLCVPLVAHGQTLGAMLFAAGGDEGRFGSFEMATAEELGRRVALAVDHALLLSFLEEARDHNEEARAEAERANRMKDEFLARVSHELRTPLGAMTVWLEVLAHASQSERAQALAAIERSVQAQAKLVDDLLDIARSISGKLRMTFEPVELRKAVETALAALQPEADARSVRLELTVDGADGPVLADAGRLHQVVTNLVSNALKFTPSGGAVRLVLTREGTTFRIVVSDTGRGIDPAFLPHIFTPFSQADVPGGRRQSGLGLGLAIVKQLVDLHGGSVQAESEGEGRGARFTVTLPAALDFVPEPGAPAEQQSEQLRHLHGTRILVVNEDDQMRVGLVRLLQSRGMKAVPATSLRNALASVQHERPDLVLCDIARLEDEGYALLRRIRALEGCEDLPVIALTTQAREVDQKRAIAAGFQAYVAKPVGITRLLGVMDAVMCRQRAR